MILKTVIIAVLLLGFIFLALGIKLLTGKRKEAKLHTCAFEQGPVKEGAQCDNCGLKDLTQSNEKEKNEAHLKNQTT